MKRALKPVYMAAVRRLAGRYVAGPRVEDAVAAALSLVDRGQAVSLAYWNPIGEDPSKLARRYAESVAAASALSGGSYVSVKLPALRGQTHLLAGGMGAAADQGIRVHFDSLGPEVADEVFAFLEGAVRQRQQPLGCTLPGRWPRSLTDADRAADLGVSFRVVKGEWPAPDGSDLDPTDGYLRVVGRLMGRAKEVSVATHDPALARRALTDLLAAGTLCDLEVLYGRPMKAVLRVADDLGVRVRVYIPFGEAYQEYASAYLLRHPVRAFGWLARDLVSVGRAHRPRSASTTGEEAGPPRG